MRTIINKEELKKEWVLENWGEKTVYVIGLINIVFMVLMTISAIINS